MCIGRGEWGGHSDGDGSEEPPRCEEKRDCVQNDFPHMLECPFVFWELCGQTQSPRIDLEDSIQEREFFIDNLLVRIHFIIVIIRWTGLGHGSLNSLSKVALHLLF